MCFTSSQCFVLLKRAFQKNNTEKRRLDVPFGSLRGVLDYKSHSPRLPFRETVSPIACYMLPPSSDRSSFVGATVPVLEALLPDGWGLALFLSALRCSCIFGAVGAEELAELAHDHWLGQNVWCYVRRICRIDDMSYTLHTVVVVTFHNLAEYQALTLSRA